MPYNLHWYDAAQTIIQVEMTGEVTWVQWQSMIDSVIQELQKRPDCRIDVIFDDYVGMPSGNPFMNLISAAEKVEIQANLGLIITVSHPNASRFVKTIIESIGRAYRLRRHYYGGFVDTVDEALALIDNDRVRRTIPKVQQSSVT